MYMSVAIPRYGLVFIDLGFLEEWKNYNKGYVGFLAAYEVMSQQIYVHPIRGKTRRSLALALEAMLEQSAFASVHTIISDLEPSATSKRFRSELREKYGVEIHFLTNRSKSYYAELLVSKIKRSLGLRFSYTKDRQWIGRPIQEFVKQHNDTVIKGTTFKRKDIDSSNAEAFLMQKNDTPWPRLFYNSATIGTDVFTKKDAKKLWKLEPGDKVLIRIDKNPRSPQYKKRLFRKKSLHGSYSSELYTIASRTLKFNNQFFLTPVYTVVELGRSHFYERYWCMRVAVCV